MISAAIHLSFYVTLFLIIGLIKPNWALFFMKAPNRLMVVVFTVIMFMIIVTMYGEGVRTKQLEQQESGISSTTTAPAPIPEIK